MYLPVMVVVTWESADHVATPIVFPDYFWEREYEGGKGMEGEDLKQIPYWSQRLT